jgi:hypothetical protein
MQQAVAAAVSPCEVQTVKQARTSNKQMLACLHLFSHLQERAAALAHNATRGFITVLRHRRGSKLEPVQLPIGSVRASLGALSTFEDVYALVQFLQDTYVDKDPPVVLYAAEGGAGGAGSKLSNMTVQEYWNSKCGA